MASSANLGAVYTIDNFIDGVWYDFSPHVQVAQDELGASTLVTLPPTNLDLNVVDAAPLKTQLNEKLYTCPECGASFSNSSNLKSHIRIHTGEKPFTCDICGISFIQSSNLKAHKRIHSGERPYKCQDCGRSFARSSHLTSHRRLHTGDQPYSCEICGKSFHTSTHLKVHIEKHKDGNIFACAVCEKSFSKASSLDIHLRVHNSERPYFCSECTGAFRSKEDLNVHKKLHLSHSLSPYSCNICGKGFRILLCCQKHQSKCMKDSKSKGKKCSDTQTISFEMQLLEGPLEEGIEEVDEQMFVLTHEDTKSSIEIVPFNNYIDSDDEI